MELEEFLTEEDYELLQKTFNTIEPFDAVEENNQIDSQILEPFNWTDQLNHEIEKFCASVTEIEVFFRLQFKNI